MAKKRKSDASRMDEGKRSMYSTFCSAANSLSQIYTQAMNQQKVSFQAGERHALEKLYQWILKQHEETARVTTADIVAYLQNEIELGERRCRCLQDIKLHRILLSPQCTVQTPASRTLLPHSGKQQLDMAHVLVTVIKLRTLSSQMLFPAPFARLFSLITYRKGVSVILTVFCMMEMGLRTLNPIRTRITIPMFHPWTCIQTAQLMTPID